MKRRFPILRVPAGAATGDASLFFSMFARVAADIDRLNRSEEHTSELQSLMRISYAVFCLKKKIKNGLLNANRHPVYSRLHQQLNIPDYFTTNEAGHTGW